MPLLTCARHKCCTAEMGLPFQEGLKEILFQDSHINGIFLGTHYVAPREKKENRSKRGYSLKADTFACLSCEEDEQVALLYKHRGLEDNCNTAELYCAMGTKLMEGVRVRMWVERLEALKSLPAREREHNKANI
jgi:hypothetical protein